MAGAWSEAAPISACIVMAADASRAWWLAFVALVAAYAIALAASAVLPLQDVPDWVYQGHVLRLLLAGDARASGFALLPYPVPNATATVLLAALDGWLDPTLAARVIALAVLLFGAAAVARFAAVVDGASAPLLAFVGFGVFALTTPFWYGYLNFCIGVALLLLFLARQGARRAPRVPGAIETALWALALFFTHAVVFGAFALVVAWRWWSDAAETRTLVALVPAAILGAWYAVARVFLERNLAPVEEVTIGGGPLQALWAYFSWKPITLTTLAPWRDFRIGYSRILPLDDFATFEAMALNVVFTALLVGALALAMRCALRDGDTTWRDLAPGLALAAAFVAAPPVHFFGLINVGERLWLLAVALLLTQVRLPRAALCGLIALTLPLHALDLVSLWRAGEALAGRAPTTHAGDSFVPYYVTVGGRDFHYEWIRTGALQPIAPGYDTGIVRNR
jgi:hypothetical protein